MPAVRPSCHGILVIQLVPVVVVIAALIIIIIIIVVVVIVVVVVVSTEPYNRSRFIRTPFIQIPELSTVFHDIEDH